MSGVAAQLGRWLPATVMALWSLALLVLVMTGRHVLYLRPDFALLLVLAHFAALGCLVALLVTPARVLSSAALVRMGILLVPLACLFVTQRHAQLAGDSFARRFIGLAGQAVEGERSTPKVQREELSILQVLLSADLWQGQRLQLVGMLMRDEDVTRQFGEDMAVLYRFVITCCVADARPVAMAVRLPPGLFPVVANGWVRVEGLFRIGELAGNRIPLLEEVDVTPVEAPAFPYLY